MKERKCQTVNYSFWFSSSHYVSEHNNFIGVKGDPNHLLKVLEIKFYCLTIHKIIIFYTVLCINLISRQRSHCAIQQESGTRVLALGTSSIQLGRSTATHPIYVSSLKFYWLFYEWIFARATENASGVHCECVCAQCTRKHSFREMNQTMVSHIYLYSMGYYLFCSRIHHVRNVNIKWYIRITAEGVPLPGARWQTFPVWIDRKTFPFCNIYDKLQAQLFSDSTVKPWIMLPPSSAAIVPLAHTQSFSVWSWVGVTSEIEWEMGNIIN